MTTTSDIRGLTLTTCRNLGLIDETAMENAVRVAQDNVRAAETQDAIIAGIRTAVRYAHEVSDRMDAEYGPQRFTYLGRKREPVEPITKWQSFGWYFGRGRNA